MPTTLSLLKQLHCSLSKPSLKRVSTFSRRPVVIQIFGESHYKLELFHRPVKERKRTLSLPGEFQGT